jgi:hypothetical protein
LQSAFLPASLAGQGDDSDGEAASRGEHSDDEAEREMEVLHEMNAITNYGLIALGSTVATGGRTDETD